MGFRSMKASSYETDGHFFRRAERDVQIAESNLIRISVIALTRWHSKLNRMIEALELDADRYPEAIEAVELGFDLRESNFGRWPHIYRVWFTIHQDAIHIHRIRHSSRDLITEADLPIL